MKDIARYLMIYIPYNGEMCNYTNLWLGELYENSYPLVSKGMWSGIVNLKTHKLLNWKSEYGSLYFQAKVCDSGTYFLLGKDKTVLCKIAGYVPNGMILEDDDCGDYIRLRINAFLGKVTVIVFSIFKFSKKLLFMLLRFFFFLS